MIDTNSSCSRVDAVKAAANQLALQLNQTPKGTPESDGYRKAQDQLQALNQDIKSNNAQKAETGLSTAASAVKQLSDQSDPTTDSYPRLDVYA